MRSSQIALQLYTVRDACRSATDLAVTLRKVRAIGYKAVETIRIPGVSDDQLRKIADDQGLRICSIHESPEAILNEPSRISDSLAGLGADFVAYPFPAGIDLSDSKQSLNLIAQLRRSSEIIARAGGRLAYHNHGLEFTRGEGKTLLELIFADAPELYAELDTYWIQYGGGNPITWIEKMRGRLSAIHLKDYAFNAKTNRPEMAELGHGNLDLTGILNGAEAAGCRWFIVEQDVCPGDPFDSIQASLNFLQNFIELAR
jgi:sugar phosphate isomerase/epimerase